MELWAKWSAELPSIHEAETIPISKVRFRRAYAVSGSKISEIALGQDELKSRAFPLPQSGELLSCAAWLAWLSRRKE